MAPSRLLCLYIGHLVRHHRRMTAPRHSERHGPWRAKMVRPAGGTIFLRILHDLFPWLPFGSAGIGHLWCSGAPATKRSPGALAALAGLAARPAWQQLTCIGASKGRPGSSAYASGTAASPGGASKPAGDDGPRTGLRVGEDTLPTSG